MTDTDSTLGRGGLLEQGAPHCCGYDGTTPRQTILQTNHRSKAIRITMPNYTSVTIAHQDDGRRGLHPGGSDKMQCYNRSAKR
jgi:hypothetical protein